MGYNFLIYGCDQDFLLPPDARDWLPAGHLSWAVIDAAGELDLSAFLAYYRSDGQGRPAYHPKMMTALVLYCYCKGIRSSRAVQMACFDDVGCRVITGNQAVDHATVARFVRRHKDALTGLFVQVLAICAREGLVTVDLVAGDGTKVKASASKAASRTLEELDVSIDELQKALEAEVTAWWHEADLLDAQDEQAAADADRAVPAAAGTRKRTAGRLARAEQAKEMLEQRHGDTKGAATALEQARQRAAKAAKRLAEETAAHHEKLDRYQASQQAKASGGGGRAGRPPKPVDQAAKVCAARSEQERADAALQRALADPDKGNVPKGNTTDPHCRIMPAKAGGYMCARNLQALANDRQIILAMLLPVRRREGDVGPGRRPGIGATGAGDLIDDLRHLQPAQHLPHRSDVAEGEMTAAIRLTWSCLRQARRDLLGRAEITLRDDPGLAVDPGGLGQVVVRLAVLLLADDERHI